METPNATLVQYRVVADHRLHFGRLYFQVIGLNLTLAAGALLAIGIGRPDWWPAAKLLVGIALVGTAAVAFRLHGQEESYASALRIIEEREAGMIRLPSSRRPGARASVVAGLALVGLLLISETAGGLI